MQNVAWPMMIVQIDRSTLLKLKNERSAIPVMMPGRARGRMNIRLTASRPKKAARWMANAAHDPRISAIAVAPNPVCTESSSAVWTLGSSHVGEIHFRLSPEMGHDSMLESLKA